jgi:hypothetical protein
MAKLAPLYLQKQLKACAAFHVLAEMYELEPMKQADQYNLLLLKYTGMAFQLFILFWVAKGIMVNSGGKHVPRWNFQLDFLGN